MVRGPLICSIETSSSASGQCEGSMCVRVRSMMTSMGWRPETRKVKAMRMPVTPVYFIETCEHRVRHISVGELSPLCEFAYSTGIHGCLLTQLVTWSPNLLAVSRASSRGSTRLKSIVRMIGGIPHRSNEQAPFVSSPKMVLEAAKVDRAATIPGRQKTVLHQMERKPKERSASDARRLLRPVRGNIPGHHGHRRCRWRIRGHHQHGNRSS